MEFLSRDRDEPFVLFLAHKALHPNIIQHDDGSSTPIGEGGFIPAERHRTLYGDAEIPRRPSYGVPPAGKPALERPIEGLPPLGLETVLPDGAIRDRLRMLIAVDESLGRMLDVLEDEGELENTVVVVTSDHGFFYGEHGLSEERRLAYEESLRIPLVVRYPPLARPGALIDPMVLTLESQLRRFSSSAESHPSLSTGARSSRSSGARPKAGATRSSSSITATSFFPAS